ncbi:hypothetical protein [Amaricoccus sp.]|uniref:DUF883 family protein n=1 Tax=Amaricoccus sp. TaxID=1872485 RepID=UPI00261BA160|nr:hypothetical protein [uncultured Amaricoccus sp.]
MSALFPDKVRDAAPDMDDLRKELAALRKQVADLVGAAAADGQKKARRLGKEAFDTVSLLTHDGEALASDVGRELRRVERRAVETVRERPGQSLAVALGLGLVVAVLLRR